MNNSDELYNWSQSSMLEIGLNEPDDFLKVKETLTRIGIESKREERTLYQSVHLLHKQGRYFLIHFKELFILDGKKSTLTIEDIRRRNTIATLLSDWGLVQIISFGDCTETSSMRQIKVVPFKEKNTWNLQSKYSIGHVKK